MKCRGLLLCVVGVLWATAVGAGEPGRARQAAAAGLNILDLESDVGGTESHPIYILQIEGLAAQGLDAIEQALAPLRAQGIKVDVVPIDTLIG